jgi:hypothetical protein
MPRQPPSATEISTALINHGGGADGVIAMRTAANIVRDTFFTNNATARAWLTNATLEDDPKVVALFVHSGGVLSGIVRRNEPGHAWSLPDGPDLVLAEFDDWGYARTDGRLRINPADGTWWTKPAPPPATKGPWHTTDRLPCIAVDLCLAGAASKCAEAIRIEEHRRRKLAKDLPYVYGLLLRAGIPAPADADYGALPPDPLFQLNADHVHEIAKVLKRVGIKPFSAPPSIHDIWHQEEQR